MESELEWVAVKMEKQTTSRGRQMHPVNWKSKETSPLERPEGTQSHQHLDFSPVRLISDSRPQGLRDDNLQAVLAD